MYLAVAVKRRAAAAELRRFSGGTVMPSIPKRLFPSVPKICGIPYLRLTSSDQIWHGNTYGIRTDFFFGRTEVFWGSARALHIAQMRR